MVHARCTMQHATPAKPVCSCVRIADHLNYTSDISFYAFGNLTQDRCCNPELR